MNASFSGFGAADLAFLSGLSANNDRDWFAAHRAAYDEGLKPALADAGLRLDPGAPVKRMPKGFEAHAGSAVEAALKRTRWIVSRPLTAAEVQSPGLPRIIAAFAADARPLLDFGWKALGRGADA